MSQSVINALTKKFSTSVFAFTCILLTSCTSNNLPVEEIPSKNYGQRIKFLVMHYTADDYQGSIQGLVNKGGASSHYLVPESYDKSYLEDELKVLKLVNENERAWHAGDSYWQGRKAINDQSIGIEIVNVPECERLQQKLTELTQAQGITPLHNLNPAEMCFFPDYDPKQIELLIELSKEILKKNVELEKSREVMVQKTDQLEMSGKYKSEFLSTMSHELRTPLNSILILSQGLANNKHNNLGDKEVEHARVIHSSGEDLLSLINDILDLSKVEEGKLELVVDDVTPKDIMDVIKQQFSYEAETKNIELISEINKAPALLKIDKHRLNQILRNFLSNAFKFTAVGSITISILNRDEKLVPTRKDLVDSEYFVIKVVDTGIGIPVDKQQSIFEAFQQADGTTSRQYGGTGLGLTISRELSHIMGGEIAVYSDGEGKGSTFAVFLPVFYNDLNVEGESVSDSSKMLGKPSEESIIEAIVVT